MVVSAAAGGVGSLAVQIARDAGATVIGLAGENHHAWLAGHSLVPVTYGEGVADRIRATADGPVDAFIDTIANWQAAETYGVKTEGTAAAASAEILVELVTLISEGRLGVPIAKVYPLSEVRDAYRELERRHTLGKIVLRP